MSDALVVLGMGGPDSVKAIAPFLYNLFTDRQLINFHIGEYPQRALAKIISSSRARKVIPQYLKMGYGGASPQKMHTDALLKNVSYFYKEKTGKELDTFGAMCYYHPFIADTVKSLRDNNYDRIIILPLYPHYSSATTGACFSKFYKAIDPLTPLGKHIEVIPYWYTNKLYSKCIADRVIRAAAELDTPIQKCHILFSAHSLPQSVVDKGDKYVSQILEHTKMVADMAGCRNYEVSYQSKVGPVKWASPSTAETIHKLQILRTDNVIVVPISFISDHIETLIELDDELIPEIKKSGLNIARSRSLNSDDDFAYAITDIITEGL